ncbi:MAG: hypothetical protein ACREQR_19185 [Candidatus Binataceae bacterium]
MKLIPDSFPIFHKRVREIAMGPDAKSAADRILHRLAPSVHQLARLAEDTPEFEQLVTELFGVTQAESLESETLADLIRRSGYYHSVLAGESPELYWQKIVDRLPFREREVRRLRLLEGCRFPRDRFSIAGHTVVRMPGHELGALGPEPRAAREFYPEEFLAQPWLTKRWFLEKASLESTGYVSDGESSLDLSNFKTVAAPKEIAAGVPASPKAPKRDRDYEELPDCEELPVELPDYVAPVLILSLYDASFFEIPLSLVCEPGWRVLQSKLNFAPFETNSIASRAADYEVRPDAWASFESFVRTCENGLKYIRLFWSRRFVTAARHYLRATFAKEDIWYHWDTSWLSVDYPEVSGRAEPDKVAEDVLLHYVFALEALFTEYSQDKNRKDTTSKRKRLATCSSQLIAISSEESEAVKDLISKSWDARSELVHGQSSGLNRRDLLNLRRVVQRTLTVILFLAADFWEAAGDPEWENLVDAILAKAAAISAKRGLPPKEDSGTPNKQRQPSPRSHFSVPGEGIAKVMFNLWNFGTLHPDVLKARTAALKLLANGEPIRR